MPFNSLLDSNPATNDQKSKLYHMSYNEYPLDLSPAPKDLKFKAQLIELQELPLNSSTFVEQMEF